MLIDDLKFGNPVELKEPAEIADSFFYVKKWTNESTPPVLVRD